MKLEMLSGTGIGKLVNSRELSPVEVIDYFAGRISMRDPSLHAFTYLKIEEALKEATTQILDTICSVLEKTPPELAGDIVDRGIVLTGGGAMLRGLEELIEDARNHGVRLVACQMSMDVMGIKQEELIDGVELGGVATFIGSGETSDINLFI